MRKARLLLLLIVMCYLGTSTLSYARPERNCQFFGQWFWVDHWAEPVDTERNGGPSSYEKPSVKIIQDSCIFAIRTPRVEMVFPAGEAGTMRGYTYFAQICSDPAVCKNRCTYGCNCIDGKPTANCGSCSINSSIVKCDQNVTSLAIYGCQNNSPENLDSGQMIGICAYRSNNPSTIDGFINFFKNGGHIFWSVDQAQKASKELGIAECQKVDGFQQIEGLTTDSWGCYPVPIAPIPPPFGHGPMSRPSKVSLHKICSIEEIYESKPVALLSNYLARPGTVCVLPADPSQIENYSTFSRPCVRVTFENAASSFKAENPGSFVDVGGNIYEQLYDFTILRSSGEYVRSRNTYTTRNMTIKDDVNDPSIAFEGPIPNGYNNSEFVDLCANVNLDGLFDKVSNTIKDPRTELGRTFTIEPFSISKKQICVQENSRELIAMRGCVARPSMKQPIAEFCEEPTINDQSNACLQIRLPDFQMTTYKFMGNPSKCNYKENDQDYMCLLSSTIDGPTNNFGFKAISTNDCYTIVNSKDDPGCAGMRGACVGECEACKFIDMCYKEKTITGLTKLCLFGYTDTYAELTPTWCTNDCNRICAKLNKGEYGSVVDTTSAARYSNQAPGITDCCSCATYGNPSSYQDRVKNPVEAGLCVDVYPFSFNDCQQFEPTSLTTQICDIMQKFCGVRESEQSGAQKYKNFVNCIEVFKACSTTSNLDLTIDKALPQGIDVPPELLSAMSQGNITMESMTCGIINSLIETR